MFDFSKIAENLAGIAGNTPANDAAPQGGMLQDIVQAAGIDPGMLDGLAPQDIIALLSEHGIDASQFSPDQISAFAQSAGVPQALTEFASSFLGNRS